MGARVKKVSSKNRPQTELGKKQQVGGSSEENFLQAHPGPELVLGLVGPVGVALDSIVKVITEVLKEAKYSTHNVHLSGLIDQFIETPASFTTQSDGYHRIDRLMTAGSDLRDVTKRGDTVALLAIEEIVRLRQSLCEGKCERNAFILRSLKHPEEVQTLRNIYGKGFVLVSVYSPRDSRVTALAERLGNAVGGSKYKARSQAETLVARDESEEKKTYGQDVKDAFPLADLFVDARSSDSVKHQTRRFFELFFGNRFETPHRDEHGMYMARAAALRSADLNRQVGAAILTKEGEVISVGCNDVPKAGGDLYWPGDHIDARDFKVGVDSSAKQREVMLSEFMSRLEEGKLLAAHVERSQINELVVSLISGPKSEILKGTSVMHLLEFGRSVHAEMAALMTAARRGLPVKGATLFSTTFPCHMCARHIVASGIERVVYVEPYPKSRARQLHEDSISVDPVAPSASHVNFEPFTGVAPRQYMDIFEAGDLRKEKNGKVLHWHMGEGRPRFTRFLNTYLELETMVIGKALPALKARWERDKLRTDTAKILENADDHSNDATGSHGSSTSNSRKLVGRKVANNATTRGKRVPSGSRRQST